MSHQNGKIYKIINDVNDKIYIGSTKQTLSQRMTGHRKDSKTRTTPFYSVVNEIGIHHFKIILIKPFPCNSKAELEAEEYRVMKELKEQGEELYNFMLGTKESHPMFGRTGESHPMFGKTHSEESKQIMSESHKGKTHSEESKKKISESNMGKTQSEETKRKISVAHIGKTHTEESKNKMSESRKGLLAGENHPMFGKFGNNNPCFKGGCVKYDKKGNRWRYIWQVNGKQKSKSFSISKYGEEEAKRLTEEYRKKIYPESVDESQYVVDSPPPTESVEIIFID